jgi:hypothetical protein
VKKFTNRVEEVMNRFKPTAFLASGIAANRVMCARSAILKCSRRRISLLLFAVGSSVLVWLSGTAFALPPAPAGRVAVSAGIAGWNPTPVNQTGSKGQLIADLAVERTNEWYSEPTPGVYVPHQYHVAAHINAGAGSGLQPCISGEMSVGGEIDEFNPPSLSLRGDVDMPYIFQAPESFGDHYVLATITSEFQINRRGTVKLEQYDAVFHSWRTLIDVTFNSGWLTDRSYGSPTWDPQFVGGDSYGRTWSYLCEYAPNVWYLERLTANCGGLGESGVFIDPMFTIDPATYLYDQIAVMTSNVVGGGAPVPLSSELAAPLVPEPAALAIIALPLLVGRRRTKPD